MTLPSIALFGEPSAYLREKAEKHFTLVPHEQALSDPGKIRGILSYKSGRLNAEALSVFPNLEIVAHHGVGYDGIDVEWCVQQGVVVTHTPGVLNADVADFAIGLLLATVRKIPQADRYVREGAWASAPFQLTPSLQGRTLGIFGMGRIGRDIAHRAEAFGLTITYHNRRSVADCSYAYHPSLLSLAQACDVLLVAAPATPQTRKSVDAQILSALGPNGILINIARGSLIDEAALIEALKQKKIWGAGLDVFQKEPTPNPEFAALSNVILAPHIASATGPTRQAMSDLVVANLVSYFDGKGPVTSVPETQSVKRNLKTI